MDNSLKEEINKLLLGSAFEILFESYSEKTTLNKMTVELLLDCTKHMNLYTDLIQFIDPKIKIDSSDFVVTILTGLWKLYNNKVSFKQLIGKEIIEYQLQRFYIEKCKEELTKYYGETTNNPLSQNEFEKLSTDCIKFIMKHSNERVHEIASKKLQLLRKNQCMQYSLAGKVDLSYCDFTGYDFSEKLIQGWMVKNCNFTKAKFKGNGTTAHCIHWKAIDCDFTDAIFEGKICTKTSNYDGSNFTNVNLTTLMSNMSEVTMRNCNFTDAFGNVTKKVKVEKEIHDTSEEEKIDVTEKLMGKFLLRHLEEVKNIPIDGSFYTSPQDNGYNGNDVDPNIWISL